MGFFRKLFRTPERFTPTAFPFLGEIRMRHPDYKRLATGWWNIAINTSSEWEAKLAEMREGLRGHFGMYVTKSGQVVPRWNDETWRLLAPALIVERKR